MEEKIIKELLKLLIKAKKENEVPVAAIIVYKNKIISKAYNKREKNNNVLGHAEILCIKKASKKLNTWKLEECTLYVTLEPCLMCKNIIQESRIKKVKYLLNKPIEKKGYDKTKYQKINNVSRETYIKNIMNNFFKNKREKNKCL